MTSASELFHNRRYRFGQNPIEREAIDSFSSLDRFSHHNRCHNYHNSRRHRHNHDGCDPLRRTANQIYLPSFPAKHGIYCLELPLILHMHLLDLEKLSSVLRGNDGSVDDVQMFANDNDDNGV